MAKGREIEIGWQPDNDDREYGLRTCGLTNQQIDEMAEDMRLWAGANSNRQIARKANWSLAFKGWMRRESKKLQGVRNGTANRSVADAAGRLIEAGFKLKPKPGSVVALEGQGHLKLLPEG